MIKFDKIKLQTLAVYVTNLGSTFNNDYLVELADQWQQDIQSKKLSNEGGWQGHHLYQADSGKEFQVTFQDTILDIVNQSSITDRTFDNLYLWGNINPPGSYNRKHGHLNRDEGPSIAGVYYVKVPENSGSIVFYEGKTFSKSYQPIESDLLLFDDFIGHSVNENKSKENRISIAFNLFNKHNKR